MVSTVEQVAGDDPGGLLSEESPPGRGRPSRGRIDLMTSQRCADRGCRDWHARPLEFALDALIAPARILAGQADDQLLDVGIQLRSAREPRAATNPQFGGGVRVPAPHALHGYLVWHLLGDGAAS
jgi:hypothetical protein